MVSNLFLRVRTKYIVLLLGFLLSVKLWMSPSMMQLQYGPMPSYLLNIIGTVMVLFSFSFLFKRHRGRFIYAITVYALASVLIVFQIVYVRYYTRPVSMHVFLEFSNLHGLGNSIWALLSAADLVMLADIFLIPVFFFPPSGDLDAVKRKTRTAYCFFAGAIFLLLMPAHMKFIEKKPLLYPWKESENLLFYNIVEYQFIDFANSLMNGSRSLDRRDRRMVRKWLAQNNNDPSLHYRDAMYGVGKNKNIIVIQCESLANFVINRKYGNREITPNINRMLKESLYFRHHHAQNFHGGTADAELILFTSLYPPLKGSAFFRFPGNSYTALPKLLKDEGYSTAAIHGNQKSFWNRGESYPSMGIDVFYDAEKMFGKKEWINDDELVLNKSVSILKNLGKPFFSIIITIETHLGADLVNIDGYFNAIHKLDASLGKFIAGLKKEGLYDDSMVILYGDHPPYLKYKEIVRNNPSLAWIRTPGREVPFIMHIPGVQPAVISRITGQVDAYPAIAYVMGIGTEKYTGQVMGKNMITTNKSYALIYPDEYLSDEKQADPAELRHRKRAFEIGDLIIRSNFFAAYPAGGRGMKEPGKLKIVGKKHKNFMWAREGYREHDIPGAVDFFR